MRARSSLNPRVQRGMVWSGVVLIVVYSVGMVLLTQFLPAPSPNDSSDEIVAMYQADKDGIRIGCALMMIAGACWITWSAVIAMWIRRMESGYPSLTYAAIGCIGFQVMIWEFFPMVWGIAAYRPGDIDAGITHTLNDTGWFLFLTTWPPFTLFCVILAIAIFNDRNESLIYPRWVAYMNLWTGLTLSPGICIMFFKTGPVDQDGIFSLYLPLVVFFGYLIAMTVMTFRAITNEEQRLAADGDQPALAGSPA